MSNNLFNDSSNIFKNYVVMHFNNMSDMTYFQIAKALEYAGFIVPRRPKEGHCGNITVHVYNCYCADSDLDVMLEKFHYYIYSVYPYYMVLLKDRYNVYIANTIEFD